MPCWLARTLLTLLLFSAIGWTIYARCRLGEWYTTSQTINRVFEACPQLGILLMLVTFAMLCDCLPGVNRWFVLCIVLALYCLGHALWNLGPPARYETRVIHDTHRLGEDQ